jgi:hypothetical protein
MEQLPKIVQQRLQATARAGDHPDPDLLTAFAEMSLNERERTQVLQHLGQCADCRQVVSLAMPEMVTPPPIPARTPWLSWPVLRWGALAACVVVVSAAVTLHYAGRQSAERVVAEQVPAPAPPEALELQSQVTNQPNQKLAAKIMPSLPFPSDRDSTAAGKLAKPREDTRARSAAIPSVSNGRETGRMEERQLEINPQRSGHKEIDQSGLDQLKKDQTKDAQLKTGQLNDNRLAMAKGDELKSANKPATLPMEQMAASAPAPAPAAESKSDDKEAQAKPPSQSPGYTIGGLSETVTVQAEATTVETSQATVGRAKKPKKESRKVQNEAAADLNLPVTGRNVSNLAVLTAIAPRWTVSPDGALQRSFDSGKTWQTIPVAGNVVFRALSANQADIWAGGAAGALYHSSDAGEHWTQIKPVANGLPLTADILTVQFSDPQHGTLSTADHETWTTSDAGASWHK